MYEIKYNDYLDKVWGGWYGKCLGGAAGAPLEGFKRINVIKDFSEIMNPDLPNDDLDIQLLWLEVLEEKGPCVNSQTLANAWLKKCWYPFSEYGYFMKNYRRGINPPYSGTFNNRFFMEGMGCPIRSEIWGFIFPGQPEKAAEYAAMDAVLDHGDNSLWAEQLLAVMESMLFLEKDIKRLLEAGLGIIPRDCRLARCIRMVMDDYDAGKSDWMTVRNKVIRKFGHPDFTNVVQNLGFTILALLYGENDLHKTINIALWCGYDVDCTCATAGAILGGILGYSDIDAGLTGLINDYFVCGINVHRRSNSIKALAEDTCKVGASLLDTDKPVVRITDIPDNIILYQWDNLSEKYSLKIIYKGNPSIGIDDTAEIEVELVNHTNTAFIGFLSIQGLPAGWILKEEKAKVNLAAKGTVLLSNTISTMRVGRLAGTNLMEAILTDESGAPQAREVFGIAGANVWKVYGPFLEQLEKSIDPKRPPAHGEGCVLPDPECMVNNAVFLEKPYVDENRLDFDILESDYQINAYEDFIPIDEHIGMEGQYCIYLEQTLESPEDRDVWAVIGNNDGFVLWVNGKKAITRDEIRYWTPYNNSEIINLTKGENRLVLKLLKRTGNLSFSLGLRRFEGKHWHGKEWIIDFSSRR